MTITDDRVLDVVGVLGALTMLGFTASLMFLVPYRIDK